MRKTGLKRRLIGFMMSVCMMLSFMPRIPIEAADMDSVASVTINGATTQYATLAEAVSVVENCTDTDYAVLKLLQDIDLGDCYQQISDGVFTLDLNGKTLSSTCSDCGVLGIKNTTMIIKDSGEGGMIRGAYAGIYFLGDMFESSDVLISGGTVSGVMYGLYTPFQKLANAVTVENGTVFGGSSGIVNPYIMNIKGGMIIGESGCALSSVMSEVSISGGTIRGGSYDISVAEEYNNLSEIKLTLGENGIGALFPDGISVFGTTLRSILEDGAAYWQNGDVVLPGVATELSGGDVTIMADKEHPGEKIYTNNGENHTYTYTCCGISDTEQHFYDSTTMLCICGAVSSEACAAVKMGGETTYYSYLPWAINAIENSTASDNAVITVLKNAAPGRIEIESGQFIIDLNGKTISNDLRITNANVTIMDSEEGGAIRATGANAHGVYVREGVLTVQGGEIWGDTEGIMAMNAEINICGGSISGGNDGIYVFGNASVTISGGTVRCDDGNVVRMSDSNLTILGGEVIGREGIDCEDSTVVVSGGRIQVETDFRNYDSYITLNVDEDGEGAVFLGGIRVLGTTLNRILGAGASFYQGNQTLVLDSTATQLIGDDVIIKAGCKHENGTRVYKNDGDTHTYSYTCCGLTVTESHILGADGMCIANGCLPLVEVTINGVTTYYMNCASALNAVSDCIAADEAVLKLLQDVDLSDGSLQVTSGVFTIDLNGKTISSVSQSQGTITIVENAIVMIMDSGTGGTVVSQLCGILVAAHGTAIVNGGAVYSNNYGIYAYDCGNVVVNGGAVFADFVGVYAYENCEIVINDGVISGVAGMFAQDCIVDINGGTVEGSNVGVLYCDSTATYDLRNYALSTENASRLMVTGGVIVGGENAIQAENSTSPIIISGGSIFGGSYDIVSSTSVTNITLIVGEDGKGATFPGGVSVLNTTLLEIVDENFVFWQDGKQVVLTEGQTEITGGDAIIKTEGVATDIRGDLDLDSDVDAEDLTILARHVAGIELLTGAALTNADVDGDGDVDANDLTQHARYVAGIITDWEDIED